jgi:tetratricopeptide (TPR) repeat protein
LLKGQYEKALTEYKKAVQLAPKSPPLYLYLAVINILLEREEEARASAEKALELAPFISVAIVSKTSRYKNQADLKLVLDAMRKAGFPDKQQTALQDSPRKEGVSAKTMNCNNVAIKLNGEWDTVYDLKEYGVYKDAVQITQSGNTFVGIKLIGTQFSPKGSETIKGDVEDNRISSIFLKTTLGWLPAEWIVNEQGDEIFLKVYMDSMSLTIDVKLTRK